MHTYQKKKGRALGDLAKIIKIKLEAVKTAERLKRKKLGRLLNQLPSDARARERWSQRRRDLSEVLALSLNLRARAIIPLTAISEREFRELTPPLAHPRVTTS